MCKDYTTISPSAKSLLLMKGYTNIPFAKEAAELISFPGKYIPDFTKNDVSFWARTVHFENRYWSISQLLDELKIKNIIEISSGFSFRGLDLTQSEGYHFIDTDLPEVIEQKKKIISELKYKTSGTSKLELIPLNALDETEFREILSHFDNGKVAVINEGLLMYLNSEEKIKLCNIIHKALSERGGWWITADIYIQTESNRFRVAVDDKSKEFFKQHKIEENKFRNFPEAERFFKNRGFVIDKEASDNHDKLSSLKYLLKNTDKELLINMRKDGKIHATWRLKAV
jgi:O-methyltransferase involved in polyketide biosynthesis